MLYELEDVFFRFKTSYGSWSVLASMMGTVEFLKLQ